MKNCAEKDLDY